MVKFGENSAKFGLIWENLRKFGKKQQKIQRFFDENFEIRERCTQQGLAALLLAAEPRPASV